MSNGNEERLAFILMEKGSVPPSLATEGSVGYDLSSAYSYEIPPMQRRLCETGIVVRVPNGCYARIAARSGLSFGYCLDIGAGVIDRDYTGTIKIILINSHQTNTYFVKPGDRIAQLVLERNFTPTPIILDKRDDEGYHDNDVEDLTNGNKDVEKNGQILKKRKDNGFGSTGK